MVPICVQASASCAPAVESLSHALVNASAAEPDQSPAPTICDTCWDRAWSALVIVEATCEHSVSRAFSPEKFPPIQSLAHAASDPPLILSSR
jgi:hypothetical protein